MSAAARLALASVLAGACASRAIVEGGQDATSVERLRASPGYERYEAATRELVAGRLSWDLAIVWADDSRSFDYTVGRRRQRFDIDTLTGAPVSGEAAAARAPRREWREDSRPHDATPRVTWSPDGSELLLRVTNRRQNVMELVACEPITGSCRTVLREAWPTGWVSDRGEMRWLSDGRRFIWLSDRTGFTNLYLYDRSGVCLAVLTRHRVDVGEVVDIDETAGLVYYTARDGDNAKKIQLHRAALDGTNDVRLTDPAFLHTVRLSPDRRYFVDVLETHDTPPTARLADARSGRVIANVAAASLTSFERLGLRRIETFEFPAGDGRTRLLGSIQFPSDFDPSRRWPVLIQVYGAPESAAHVVSERFEAPDPATELGFLVVTLDTRAAPGFGKAPLDAIHRRLGQADVDDLANGIRALGQRPWVDTARVGIHGTSYGGYLAAMVLLRYSELVAAASASSPVTEWERYDAIYTERYMGSPQENPDGYRAASLLTHAAMLRGRLLLYYGDADDRVSPQHTQRLLLALRGLGKTVDVEVGHGEAHTSVSRARMLAFFLDQLSPSARAPSVAQPH